MSSTPEIKRKPANRRGSDRKPARQSIRLECRRGSTGFGVNIASGFLNISLSGVQVLTRDVLQIGDEVEVILEGYGFRGSIRRIGEVRWTVAIDGGGFRTGVRFAKYLTYRELQTLSN
jgi:hypothetical protein